MSESLEKKKTKLKNAILASLMLDKEQVEEIFALIESMNEAQLGKTEKHFAKAKLARDNVIEELFKKDKKAIKVVEKIVDRTEKHLKVDGISSLGREVLKKTIKK